MEAMSISKSNIQNILNIYCCTCILKGHFFQAAATGSEKICFVDFGLLYRNVVGFSLFEYVFND